MLLRGEGEAVNHKRVERLYREVGLGLRRKRLERVRTPQQPAAGMGAGLCDGCAG